MTPFFVYLQGKYARALVCNKVFVS